MQFSFQAPEPDLQYDITTVHGWLKQLDTRRLYVILGGTCAPAEVCWLGVNLKNGVDFSIVALCCLFACNKVYNVFLA